ncbi:UDP-N-acetylglucosamine 2-epimerase (non-hydrolyzing) [bacterium]|nr:UDP-N-acetylglucosamine 2-epimerase (non-hydrolyzing) [bacterium]
MHIVSIVGARPNFVKLAPLARKFADDPDIRHTIIHTGQHYDATLSDSFFQVLDIPAPHHNLGVGSATHGVQTGKIMVQLDPLLSELQPDILLVLGDVNSTAAAAMVAAKIGIKIVHVEAGLRSFDRSMPEEINRIVTDQLSDLLFVTEQAGVVNLANEGIDSAKIHLVGNVMIDSLVHLLPKAEELVAWKKFRLDEGSYLLVTLHRPSNVDSKDVLEELVEALLEIANDHNILFPIHPRTKASLKKWHLLNTLRHHPHVITVGPQDYLSFLSLVTQARGVITDSGGIQEETTWLNIPCMTLRPNTERPSTIDIGTNELIKPGKKSLLDAFDRLNTGQWKEGMRPPLWDGNCAERILKIIKSTC